MRGYARYPCIDFVQMYDFQNGCPASFNVTNPSLAINPGPYCWVNGTLPVRRVSCMLAFSLRRVGMVAGTQRWLLCGRAEHACCSTAIIRQGKGFCTMCAPGHRVSVRQHR